MCFELKKKETKKKKEERKVKKNFGGARTLGGPSPGDDQSIAAST